MTTDPKPHLYLRSEIRDAISSAALTLALAERAGLRSQASERNGKWALLKYY